MIWRNFFQQPELAKSVITVPYNYSIEKIVKEHVLKPPAIELEVDLQKLFIGVISIQDYINHLILKVRKLLTAE